MHNPTLTVLASVKLCTWKRLLPLIASIVMYVSSWCSGTSQSLEYMISLFDVDRAAKKKRASSKEKPLPVLAQEHVDIFARVLDDVKRTLASCAYHFVDPSIWGYVERVNESAGILLSRTPAKSQSESSKPRRSGKGAPSPTGFLALADD